MTNMTFDFPLWLIESFSSQDKDVSRKTFSRIFFRRKPALMLIALKKISRARYGSILAKEVDCTYSHAVKILQTLEKLGLVVFEKKGRIKLIKLTKKGDEVAGNIESIRRVVG